jgi:hypothetical protein
VLSNFRTHWGSLPTELTPLPERLDLAGSWTPYALIPEFRIRPKKAWPRLGAGLEFILFTVDSITRSIHTHERVAGQLICCLHSGTSLIICTLPHYYSVPERITSSIQTVNHTFTMTNHAGNIRHSRKILSYCHVKVWMSLCTSEIPSKCRRN